jgi:coenzyme F420-reducing hydrogenase gamma subunit
MTRPKVAFFDFSSCEGCQLQIANLGEALFDVLDLVELVEFREVMSEKWSGRYTVTFAEGSINSDESAGKLRMLRERSDVLVAFGSCAATGGVNGMQNRIPREKRLVMVYGDQWRGTKTRDVRAIHQVVKVDYTLFGCPINPKEFLSLLKAILGGISWQAADNAVCVECKFNENVCMYDRGATCLGPITRGGCNSWCVNNGNVCYGCRGMVSNPNRAGAEEVLRAHGLKPELIAGKMGMYTGALEVGNGT